MRYILVGLCLFLCVCANGQSYKVNSNGGLNLREHSGTESKTLSTLTNGTKVVVVDKSNDKWWKVEEDGKTGYVSSAFLISYNSKKSDSSRSTSEKAHHSGNKTTSTSSSGSTGSYSNTNVSGSWAAGVRLGDPLGITVKKYLQRERAFEINFGRTTYWGYNYKEAFFDNSKYKDYEYHGYAPNGAIAVQFHYLYHNNIRNAEGLQWYIGFGPQLKVRTYSFQYSHRVYYGSGPNDYKYVTSWEKVSDLDLGLDGVAGMEYKFPNSVFSMFGEFNLFIELVDKPLHFGGQGGVGFRFHF